MTEPLTVVEVASYLRLDDTSSPIPEYDLLVGLIKSARTYAENYTGRSIVIQSRTVVIDTFQQFIPLPYGDVTSIDSITYYDTSGNTQTVDDYLLVDNVLYPGVSSSWPPTQIRPDAITIQYQAGYETVPEPIKQAMLLLVGNYYDNRASIVQGTILAVNPTVENLLFPYRINLGL